MKYCMNTSTISGQKLSLPETIKILGETGYQGVEPWIRELDAYVAAGGKLADLRKQAEDAGLAIVDLIGFYTWSVDDPGERAAGLEEARRCFAIAEALGCKHIAAPPMGWVQKGGLDLWAAVERYRALIEIGRDFNVVPILEFWGPAQSLGHLGEALLVVAECGEPEACLLADIYHMYKKGTSHAGLNHCGPDTIALVHMNDYPAQPSRETIVDADRIMPGDGVADWDLIRSALRHVHYDGFVSLELFNKQIWAEDPKQVAARGLSAMKRVLE